MGNYAFSGGKQIPKSAKNKNRSKSVFVVEQNFRNGFCRSLFERKCGIVGLFANGFWCFVRKIFVGRKSSQCQNQIISAIFKIQQRTKYRSYSIVPGSGSQKRLDINRNGFGIRDATSFCYQHHYWRHDYGTIKGKHRYD